MKIYIDTNTFPASPALYADAEKTKALPRILPAVELQRGGFEVAFLGANQPQDIATVSLAASIEGTQTQVVAEIGRKSENEDAWQFDFALNSEALVDEIAKHGSARLRVGVIVEDDTERREWQLVAVVYPSASGEASVEQVESAKNFAELAEQAAKRAQEAQADVAGNAQLAEQSKQTAMQAANAAIEAADNAEVSERNAAESKGAAEQAKTAAESAKEAALKAASDAQATLGNVYTKAEVDGVDTGAEVTVKMNEIHAMLNYYEEVTGETLPLDFWEAVMAEFQRWQENPNEKIAWTPSTCPYFETKSEKPIVAFNVTTSIGSENKSGMVNPETNVPVFLPYSTNTNFIACLGNADISLIAPSARSSYMAFYGNKKVNRNIYFLASNNCHYLAFGANLFGGKAILKACTSANDAFVSTSMSEENIAATLDSLPSGPVSKGGTGVIRFSRYDKTKLEPLMREHPSVVAATARGWTVQFD